jgi:predicted ATP-dependent Lon-type protease
MSVIIYFVSCWSVSETLVRGIWCITDVTYEVWEDPRASPWQIDTLKPIQIASIDLMSS